MFKPYTPLVEQMDAETELIVYLEAETNSVKQEGTKQDLGKAERYTKSESKMDRIRMAKQRYQKKTTLIRVSNIVYARWKAAKTESKCKSQSAFAERLLDLWDKHKSTSKRNADLSGTSSWATCLTGEDTECNNMAPGVPNGASVCPEEYRAMHSFYGQQSSGEVLESEDNVIVKAEIHSDDDQFKTENVHEEIDSFVNSLKTSEDEAKIKDEIDDENKDSKRVVKRVSKYAASDWTTYDSESSDESVSVESKDKTDSADPDFELSDELDDSQSDTDQDEMLENELSTSSEIEEDKTDTNAETEETSDKRITGRKRRRTKLEMSEDKLKPKKEKKPWISIKLEDHKDKYTLETFESFEQKNRKNNVSEDLFSCLVCKNFKCGDKLTIENHIEQHVNKVLECEQCSYITNSIKDISLHRGVCVVSSKDFYTCELCGKSVRKSEKSHHLGKYHDIAKFKCKFCKDLFKSDPERIKHMRGQHPEQSQYCNGCKKTRTRLSKEEFVEHVKVCTGRRQCQICGVFIARNGLMKHVVSVHQKIKSFKCEFCPYMSSIKTMMTRHKLTHIKANHPYRCDQCMFSCAQPYQLTSHMRTHTGEKPFKCTLCKYAAAWNVQLKDHLKVHTMDTAVKCEQCDILFKNQKCLNMHLKKDHV